MVTDTVAEWLKLPLVPVTITLPLSEVVLPLPLLFDPPPPHEAVNANRETPISPSSTLRQPRFRLLLGC